MVIMLLKTHHLFVSVIVVFSFLYYFSSETLASTEAKIISQSGENKFQEVNKLYLIGVEQFKANDIETAITYFEKALSGYISLKDSRGVSHTLISLGTAYMEQERYQKSIDTYLKLLRIPSLPISKFYQGQIRSKMGQAYKALGQYSKSIEVNQAAIEIMQQLNKRQDEGRVLINLGNVYESLGDYKKAKQIYQESLAIAQETGDRYAEQIVKGNLGLTYTNLKEYKKALVYHKSALRMARQDRNHPLVANSLLNIGMVYHIQREFEQAFNHYTQCLEISKFHKIRSMESSALGSLGLIASDLKNYKKAIDYYQQALVIAEEIDSPLLEARSLNNWGHSLYNSGDFSASEVKIRQAIKLLESLKPGQQDINNVSLFDTQVFSYNLLQQVLVKKKKYDAALVASEQGRARAFRKLLTSKDSEEIKSVNSLISFSQIQKIAIKNNLTLVEYSIIPEDSFTHFGKQLGRGTELYIWVVQPTGILKFKKIEIDIKDSDLAQLIQSSRKAIGVRTRGGFEIDYNPKAQSNHLKKMHEILIDPIDDFLPDNSEDHVVFIPQNEFFLTPFPALKNESEEYLVKKHTILTAPSIQVLDLTYQKRQSQDPVNDLSPEDILVVGNPKMPSVWDVNNQTKKQLSDLRGARQEAIDIAALLGSQALTDADATETRVSQEMLGARIIHLATHGLLEYGKPQDSGIQDIPGALALAPDKDKEEDGLLTTSEILDELDLKASLVVLSACDTGLGDITGDGVIGLSRSFIAAGSPSVIVSLWAVPDMPTAQLMTEFYRQWHLKGLDKAQALRQAMLETMKDNPEPANWAAFTLIGSAQ
ncbi:CHAT domain-containing tetratricopeptide repeat protein [Acaryochloris sp. IP29b_bin.148]|uniref:CHAT domain-containing protein n=1 Tax=Acaryochloris sp. IP29b_bin.148 TaxID=2969218 RepID=UPI0026344627|nr:CHAT domain-containing tetratricopeptide repeat protein [Acaryochloris sp. IP29b_bin.148]